MIGSLSSEAEIELLAKNRFSGLGKTVSKGDQINVRASDNRDAGGLRHKIQRPCAANGFSKLRRMTSLESALSDCQPVCGGACLNLIPKELAWPNHGWKYESS
jgi:hypothetical protein